MANDLSRIGSALTWSARALLDAVQDNLVFVPHCLRDFPGLAGGYGPQFEISEVELAGGAAERLIGGAATATDLRTRTRTGRYVQKYIGVTTENQEAWILSADIQENVGRQLGYEIAKSIDSDVAQLFSQTGETVGELDGTTIFGSNKLDTLNQAALRLDRNNAPKSGRVAVLGSKETYNFRSLEGIYRVDESGSAALLRNADPGSIFGFQILSSNLVETSTGSVAAETASPGALVGAHSRGATTLSVNGLGAGSVKIGTSLSLGAFNYAVTETTAIAGNAAVLPISPALRTSELNAAVVTFVERTAGGSESLAWAPDAILIRNRVPPAFPDASISSVTVSDEQTGLGVRLATKSFLSGAAGVAYSTEIFADTFVAVTAVRPEWIVRMQGEI